MRPRLVALGLATVSLLAATGCERPTPIVSFVADGVFVHTEAARYCRRHDPCRAYSRRKPMLKVNLQSSIGIDVPRNVADDGWYVEIADRGRTDISHSHYRALPANSLFQGPGDITLTVVKVQKGDKDQQTTATGQPAGPAPQRRGEWTVTLRGKL
jgi:hypothetical protein